MPNTYPLLPPPSLYAIAVGTPVAGGPPRRSVRAELPHTALTLDVDDQSHTLISATSRTLSNPRGLEARHSVRSSSNGSALSMVSPLPSTDSADSEPLSLFACFYGTMELSDSPATCMSDLWHRAFSDRSASVRNGCRRGLSASVRKVSNRACGLRLRGGHAGLACIVRHDYCLPRVSDQPAVGARVGHHKEMFSEFNTQPGCTPAGTVRSMVGFDAPHPKGTRRRTASLGAKATG
jgi:hypothetical protein